MLKSETEQLVRRVVEEHNAQFTEEQMNALAEIVRRIAGRTVEEAFASYRPGTSQRPGFFTQ